MNTIQANIDKSDYDIYDDFMNIKIDGKWIDEHLDSIYPGNMYKGLIPTLLYAMEQENERDVVWKRIKPANGQTAICPILMCPDDCDFSCTIIVAEIKNEENKIKWMRMGLDVNKRFGAQYVGSDVKWFDQIPQKEFKMSAYDKLLSNFKKQYEIDETNYLERRTKLINEQRPHNKG